MRRNIFLPARLRHTRFSAYLVTQHISDQEVQKTKPNPAPASHSGAFSDLHAKWIALHSRITAIETDPQRANQVIVGAWLITRIALFLALLIGHSYCDPEFYKYAGLFASGQWPYRNVPVEYPPIAMLLLLLPAVPLLPFSAIAPRPDAAFAITHITNLPQPYDQFRYGAYGISFAIEMLLIDAFTLWLVRRFASRRLPGDPLGLRASLLYIALVAVNGALLQKFDLASGTFCLLAVILLLNGRARLAWVTVALATLLKGFPLLILVIFVAIAIHQSRRVRILPALRAMSRQLLTSFFSFAAVIISSTLVVVVGSSWQAFIGTFASQANRGPEIESMYANGILAVGWLPTFGAHTTFSADGLSRIVVSPLDGLVGPLADLAFGGCLLLAYLALWRAISRIRGVRHLPVVDTQLTLIGVSVTLLAFLVTFKALPVHYLLDVLPLATLIRLPRPRLQWLWLISLFAISLFGQGIINSWHALVLLHPWAVILLSLRNSAWIVAFVVLLVALWQWPRTSMEAPGRR